MLSRSHHTSGDIISVSALKWCAQPPLIAQQWHSASGGSMSLTFHYPASFEDTQPVQHCTLTNCHSHEISWLVLTGDRQFLFLDTVQFFPSCRDSVTGCNIHCVTGCLSKWYPLYDRLEHKPLVLQELLPSFQGYVASQSCLVTACGRVLSELTLGEGLVGILLSVTLTPFIAYPVCSLWWLGYVQVTW